MISIIMGSKSDYEIVKKAMDALDRLSIKYEVKVLSAHRTPDLVRKYVLESQDKTKVYIAAAGKAAHLGGVIASYTVKPVIAIPIKTSDLGGMDSLLSTVQMPSGIPVATVAINGAENAAILAAQMLSLNDREIENKLLNLRKEQVEKILKCNEDLN